jgi:hypothetical protein
MKVGELLSLGTRLALGGDRGAKVRFTLMATGVAIGVALLTGALGAWAGLNAREDRRLARECLCDEMDALLSDATLWIPDADTFFFRDLRLNFVAPVGDAPVPPGIDRIPAPGEAIVSPALRDILEGPEGRMLTARIPARVVGTIASSGLVEPGELTAYIGTTAEDLGAPAIPVRKWGIDRSADVGDIDLAVLQILVFGTAALLIPILVFIWTATRLSASRREERLAAIRLLGGTPGQVRLLAAVETGLASATGTIAGILLFLLGRQVVPYLLPAGARLFPNDIEPPLGVAVPAIALVPILSVLVGWLALRKVTRNPMQVVRKARRGSWITVPSAALLALGLALWIGLHWTYGWINQADWRQAAYLLSAWILTAAGVLGVSPWIGSRAASVLTRFLRGTGPWLGARRLAHDPGAAGRVSAGVVVVVFAASVTLGYLPLLGGVRSGGASEALSDGVVSVDLYEFGGPRSTTKAVSSVEGVGATVPMRFLVGGHGAHDVAILPCSQLGSVLRTTPPGCATGAVLVNGEWTLKPARDGGGGLRLGTDLRLRTQEGDRVGTIHVPSEPEITEFRFLEGTQLLIDEAAVSHETLSAAPVSRLLVQTDGRPETIEQIREALARLAPSGYSSVSTRAMLAEFEAGGGTGVATAVRIGTIIALAVAAASMLISTIGGIQDRRRPLAALAAVGVPKRALRWSVAVQTMAPLLAGTFLAACTAMIVVASTANTQASEPADTLPVIAPIIPIVAFAVLAGVVATLLAFPSAGRSISPDALHHE